MSAALIAEPEHGSLGNAETTLDQQAARLEALLAPPRLTPEAFVEITAIFNNTSYIFLYLEANDDQAGYEHLLPRRDALYKNPTLDRRILARLMASSFDDPKVEMSRRAYVDQLSEKLLESDQDGTEELDRLKAEVQRLEIAVAAEQRATIERVGLRAGEEHPSALFYHVISRTERAQTREKLERVWASAGGDHRRRIADTIDRMVAVRRRRAAAKAAGATPLALTLRKCRLDEARILPFLERYMELALQTHSELEEELRLALGDDCGSMAHFSFYLRQRFGMDRAFLFDLDACLRFCFEVAKAVFELDFSVESPRSSPLIVADVTRRGEAIGKINFDLWRNHGKDMGANHTLSLKNRSQWGRIVQRPEAWVSCRFKAEHSEKRLITFQNVHSLFHEFGHAINHLLTDETIPNLSGLEYLPLERLECLSMWSEKWAYHPAFGEFLGLSGERSDGLKLCQQAKKAEYRRTYLERVVVALLDFECHRRPSGTLRDCFDELDAKWGISRFVRFGDLPAYFAWPMFMANPGANFAYLWGAAWSSAHIGPFMDLSLSEIAALPTAPQAFEPCFRFDLPSVAPCPESVFSFYREAEAVPPPAAEARR